MKFYFIYLDVGVVIAFLTTFPAGIELKDFKDWRTYVFLGVVILAWPIVAMLAA